MESRTKNSKRNIFFGSIQKIMYIVLGFVVKSALIYSLGTVYLGLNGLFSSVLQVLSLTELGFGEAMVFSMYKPLADKDDTTVCALLNLYKKIYRIIGGVVLGIGLLLIPFLKYFIHGEIPDDVNLYVLYIVYLLNTAISYFLFAYKQSIFIASQRSDIINNVSTIITSVLNILQILVLFVFKDYYAFCILMPLLTIVRNVIVNSVSKKMYPQYFCRGTVSEEIKKEIQQRVEGVFIYKLGGVFRNSFDSIIISSFLGLVILGQYQNYFYIISSLAGILSVITSSITASVGNSIVKESVEKNYKDFNTFQFIYMWIVGWCTVCLFVLYQPFIQIWVGEKMLFSQSIMIIFCVYFYTTQMGNMCYVYRQAAGIWYQDRYRPIVEAVVNLGLNILLVKIIGVSGVLLSTILCLIFINCAWGSVILYKNYFINNKISSYYYKIIFYAIVTVLACGVTNMICKVIPFSGVLLFVIKIGLCIIIPNIVFSLILRFCSEYKVAYVFLREKIMRN